MYLIKVIAIKKKNENTILCTSTMYCNKLTSTWFDLRKIDTILGIWSKILVYKRREYVQKLKHA